MKYILILLIVSFGISFASGKFTHQHDGEDNHVSHTKGDSDSEKNSVRI